jgi:hypothetical protein
MNSDAFSSSIPLAPVHAAVAPDSQPEGFSVIVTELKNKNA